MTCKDCIHERVCYALIKDGLPYMDDEHPAEAFCMTFRNKLDLVIRGEWIMHTNFDGNLNHYECSVCHQAQGHKSNYCEECGADMREDY